MRHSIATFLLLLLTVLEPSSAGAADLAGNQRPLGYTVTDDIDINGAVFGTAGTYSIGAVLTPKMLEAYAGCRIVGIRMAAAVDLGRARTFIYNAGASLSTPLIEQRQHLYEGWNNVFFNGDGYEIVGDETLFFGFDYVETAEMIAAEKGGICGVGSDTDGAFYLLQNGALYQITGAGRLCVQLIVDVSSLPLYDIDLTLFDAGFKYKKAGETIETFINYANTGRADLTNYRLGYQLDDQQPVVQDFTQAAPAEGETAAPLLRVGGSETWQFQLPLPADMPIGEHRLRVFVADAEGTALAENSRNDELAFSFGVYENSVERSKVYMEVYTDQRSPYVPYLNSALSKILSSSSSLADKLAVANVHRPGTPLAIDAGAYLHELYAYTWPTFTSNRSYFPMEEHIAYDMNDYLLYGDDLSISIIGGIIAQDLSMPSFATVDLQADYAADSRQLTVTATGTTLPEAEAICGDLALTLLLVEDGVKGEQVVYNALTQQATTNRNYQHNQVLRGYMTQPTGDRIDISGDSYTFSRTLTLDSGWQADKLTVIALLTKYADTVTADNVLDMDVINCNSMALSAVMGMAPIRTEVSNDSDTWYSLSGQRVKPTGKGVFIHNGKKILR